jgi:hypothetical protein
MCTVFIVFLLLVPFSRAANNIINPREVEEVKQAVTYINKNWAMGDIIYLYYSSALPFKYYNDKNGMCYRRCIIGISYSDKWLDYFRDLDKLRGNQRVWVLISHNCNWKGVDEEKLFIQYLNSIGVELQHFNAVGASAYLYNLKNSSY